MKKSGLFGDLFGLCSPLKPGKFTAVLCLDFVVFWALLFLGSTLWRHFKAGPLHILGGILMPLALLEGGWALVSLVVRFVRGVGLMLWPQTHRVSEGIQNNFPDQPAVSRFRKSQVNAETSDNKLGNNVRILRPTGPKLWGVVMSCLLFCLISPFMILHPENAKDVIVGWAGLTFFGPGGIFIFIKMILGRPELRLDDEAFSLVTFGQSKRYLWTDIDKPFIFYRADFGSGVVFSLRHPTNPMQKFNKKFNGYSGGLLDNYGCKTTELANLMNDYRTNALLRANQSSNGSFTN